MAATEPVQTLPSIKRLNEYGTRKLSERHFEQEEFAYARFAVTLPVDWTVEETLKPEFWANVAYRLRTDPMSGRKDFPGSIITVRSADHSFYAELYVRAVQDAGLVIALVREPVYFGLRNVKSDNFETRWNVGKRMYDIIRNSDREIVASVKTKESAQDWIDKTMRTAS